MTTTGAGVAPARTGALGELLVRHRTAAGLGQRELAERCGLSERAIRDLERGVRTPRAHSVRAVAAALGLAGDDLSAFLAAARPVPARDAPPVPAVPSTVPGDLIGRDRELAALADLATGARYRLVTVTGPAGVGKSRLATELAATLAPRTGLAVRTLDLSAVYEPELVDELIAGALGCGTSALPPVERIAAHLRDRRLVLLLDRFEQLVAAAPVLATLVRRCPGLTVVVTSQRPLRVRDERVVSLRPLDPQAAIALFARRAAAARPELRLTDEIETGDTGAGDAGAGDTRAGDTAEAVAGICQRVGYLPLAIELAAARVRLLHPVELAARLDSRLQVLTDGARDLPPRHRSLRAAIEASLEVVTAPGRTLFRWLGAFAGGAALDAVEATATAMERDREWLLDALTELVDINLVRSVDGGGTTRYTLPDAVAELAARQLADGPDRTPVMGAVAAHFLDRLRRAIDGSGPPVPDHDAANVRAAIAWALAHEPGLVDPGAIHAIHRFYEATGRLAEGRDLLCRVAAAGMAAGWVRAGQLAVLRGDLDDAEDLGVRGLEAATDPELRSAALSLLAHAAVERGQPRLARARMRAALVQARRVGDVGLIGRVLNNLSSISVELGRPRDAQRQLRAALEAKCRAGAGPLERGRTLFNLAEVALEMGDTANAVDQGGKAAELLLAAGYTRLAAVAETTRGLALMRGGAAPSTALAAMDRAAALLDAGDDRRTAAVVDLRRSVALHAAGELAAARDATRRGLREALRHDNRDRDELADALQTHAWYLVRRDPDAAAALIGAGRAVRRRPVPAALTPLIDQTVAAARSALGGRRFTAAHGRGADAVDLDALCDRIAVPPA
ncbi:ATP-binding protein [Phytohabitans aurantiacus]|uniref:ATP-binding protein n=1 Tax=Phytohabitans aurantiacus TaxID=3016789 RepID=UPI00248FF823|nr:helix-turn-helix domain-containing protein [Phytohabitans aurantiacus]